MVTLLDLAPWELPAAFQRSTASRFGQRLRGQLLREAAAVIVGTEATARGDTPARCTSGATGCGSSAGAARPAFAFDRRTAEARRGRGRRRAAADVGLPERYLVYSGRYDVRQDLATLLAALASLAAAGRPDGLPAAKRGRRASCSSGPARPTAPRSPGQPRGQASARRSPTPRSCPRPCWPAWSAVRGRSILPVVSDAAGLPAIEAIAAGTPVVASAVGALPEIVGTAGLLVEPRDPDRLAVALATIWADDRVHERVASEARERAMTDRRTWADVAAETRGDLRRGRDQRGLTARVTLASRWPRAAPDDRQGAGEGDAAGAPVARVPSLIEIGDPMGMTWTKVWPTVSTTWLPLAS